MLKGASPEQIRQAVRVAAAGEAIICAELAARVPAYFAQAPPGPGTLSARERELAALVARGRTSGGSAAGNVRPSRTIAGSIMYYRLAARARSCSPRRMTCPSRGWVSQRAKGAL